MALFSYRAQDAQGNVVKGEAEANDDVDLQANLKREGLALLSAEEKTPHEHVARVMKDRVLAQFCFKLSELLAAGVPLIRALGIIVEEETTKSDEAAVYQGLIDSVKKGNQLSEAMTEANGAFPPLLVNMVRSSEESGNMAEVFANMAAQYDKQAKFASRIKAATLYPKILSVLIVVVVAIIVGFVLPQFKSLFDQMPSLPTATVILLDITDFVSAYWLQIIVAFIACVLVWNFAVRVPEVRLAVDKAKIKMPVFGKNQRMVCTARFARSFASLYNAGIGAVTALQIGAATVGNAYIESQFPAVIDSVLSGHPLSEAFAGVDGLASKFVASVRIGEESGSLEKMLSTTADTMDFEAEEAMKRMVGYLEPAMIVLMAFIVGFIIIAVIVPIYSSYQSIGAGTTGY